MVGLDYRSHRTQCKAESSSPTMTVETLSCSGMWWRSKYCSAFAIHPIGSTPAKVGRSKARAGRPKENGGVVSPLCGRGGAPRMDASLAGHADPLADEAAEGCNASSFAWMASKEACNEATMDSWVLARRRWASLASSDGASAVERVFGVVATAEGLQQLEACGGGEMPRCGAGVRCCGAAGWSEEWRREDGVGRGTERRSGAGKNVVRRWTAVGSRRLVADVYLDRAIAELNWIAGAEIGQGRRTALVDKTATGAQNHIAFVAQSARIDAISFPPEIVNGGCHGQAGNSNVEELDKLNRIENVSASLQLLLHRIENSPDPLLPITSGPTNTLWDRWFERLQDSHGCKCWLL
ncbi:Guanine nucleotide-binding protein subunit gamma 1 [Platanthera zijinensis]|uniref:Guanine nucleotide-binding protein subunit gamma 1 n=1 Tax=Platanthera zijinensis TaxID=2320716 RepID=A0AAP0BLB2_9ASPA